MDGQKFFDRANEFMKSGNYSQALALELVAHNFGPRAGAFKIPEAKAKDGLQRLREAETV